MIFTRVLRGRSSNWSDSEKPLETPLRRVIGAAERKRDTTAHRGYVYDRPRALRAKVWQDFAHHVHHASQIRGNLPLDLLPGRILKRPDQRVTGVVDDGFARAKMRVCVTDCFTDAVCVGDVQPRRQNSRAVALPMPLDAPVIRIVLPIGNGIQRATLLSVSCTPGLATIRSITLSIPRRSSLSTMAMIQGVPTCASAFPARGSFRISASIWRGPGVLCVNEHVCPEFHASSSIGAERMT